MQALCDLQCPPYAPVGFLWLYTAVYHSYSQISASSGPRDLTRFSQLSMQLSYWEKKSIISFWSFIKSAKQIDERRCKLFHLKYDYHMKTKLHVIKINTYNYVFGNSKIKMAINNVQYMINWFLLIYCGIIFISGGQCLWV